jgi:hypothetical protein
LHQLRLCHGPDRNHPALRIADVYPVDIADVGAKWRLCLDIHLPRATKYVEVVHVVAAECRLQRVEDIGDLDPQHLGLVAIDLEVDLRRLRRVRSEYASEFGLSVGRNNQAAQCSRDVGGGLALQRLQYVLESARVTEPKNGRQIERKSNGAWYCGHLRPQPGDNGRRALGCFGAFFVGLQSDDEKCLVRRRDVIDEVQSYDR